MPQIDYDIFSLGFNKLLSKVETSLDWPSGLQEENALAIPSILGSGFFEISPSQIGSGEIGGNLTMIAGVLQSANFVSGSSGWQLLYNGVVEFSEITLYGGTIKYGKTAFTDSTNAGYWIGALGFYMGGASDVTKLKYTIADGSLSFIGNLLNSAGAIILNSSAATILKDFTFSPTDYSGAFKAGDIAWNTTTGVITGGSGIVIYKKGIVGAAAGVVTFSIDATTGNAFFAGTLSAPSGTLGTITSCDITGGTFKTAISGRRTWISAGSIELVDGDNKAGIMIDADTNNRLLKFIDFAGNENTNLLLIKTTAAGFTAGDFVIEGVNNNVYLSAVGGSVNNRTLNTYIGGNLVTAGKRYLHILSDEGSDDDPGCLVLYDHAGVPYYLWVDQTGDLRIHTSAPADEDADGNVVGTQS